MTSNRFVATLGVQCGSGEFGDVHAVIDRQSQDAERAGE